MPSSGTPPTLRAAGGTLPRRHALAADNLVSQHLLDEGRSLPFVFEPVAAGVDLATWALAHRPLIETQLAIHGGLLFRGFAIEAQQDFERFVDAWGVSRMHYLEGATPRRELGHQVYTSTEFPPEHHIALHNELSYTMAWPMKIAFCCLQPAASGGETPIADVRRVLARIPSDVRQRFAEAHWMLVRNYGRGFGLSWSSVFRTDDKREVERYCRESEIEWEWLDETRLRTRQVRPATARHPSLGHVVWFNHIAFWHASSLDPESRRLLVSEFGEEGLPYNTYYGDGQPIADDVVEILRQAYEAETVRFSWQQGDVLCLDNMLAAHGRGAYSGPRQVIVAMGDAHQRDEWRRRQS
jgi:alpha-ketoglutarate-dependent taurine dioxygenase